eukprot:270923_1
MSSSNIKKSLDAIKKRIQTSPPDPNLSHSLIDPISPEQSESPQMTISIHPDFGATTDKITKTSRTKPKPVATERSSIKSKRNARRAALILHSPKYLTEVARKIQIPSNPEGQATVFLPFICHCVSTHIKIFYISWIALFVCFLSWIKVLQTSGDIGLTTHHQSTANILQYMSSTIFCIFFGDLCDKIGARYSYILLFILSFISLASLTFIPFTPVVYMFLSFFAGMNAASFAITQYHITSFFASTCVGFVNGLATGFGVFSAGLLASLFPLFADVSHMHIAHDLVCKYALIIPILLLIIMTFVYYFFTIESPKGNISKESVNCAIIFGIKRYKWKRIITDYRIWILSLAFGACCGMEQTLLNHSFALHMDVQAIVFAMNLCTRGFGGYISDVLHLKYGIQGRIYCLFWSLLFECMFIIVFAFNSYGSGSELGSNYSVLMMIFAALYCQITQGIVFSIVPNLPHQLYIGLCMGIITAGGGFVSMLCVFLFEYVSYEAAWIICSVFVFCASFAVLLVKFSKKEISDDLRTITNAYWASAGTKFRSKPVTNKNGDAKTGAASPGFVIH